MTWVACIKRLKVSEDDIYVIQWEMIWMVYIFRQKSNIDEVYIYKIYIDLWINFKQKPLQICFFKQLSPWMVGVYIQLWLWIYKLWMALLPSIVTDAKVGGA